MTRAATYLRVSSRPQESKYGFEIQLETAQTYAQKISADIATVYRDVITGKSATRHDLERLKADANKYDIVIIPRTDRVARDFLVGPQIVAELIQCGLVVHLSDIGVYDPNDPSSVFMFAMQMARAHVDHRNLTNNMQRGKLTKIKGTDKNPPQLLFKLRGYGFKNGMPYESELKWVRQMFEWNLDTGAYTIARRLNTLGVSSPTGGVWHNTSVQSILSNPVYKGQWQYGRKLICDKCNYISKISETHLRSKQPINTLCKCGATMKLERYTVAVEPVIEPQLWDKVNDATRSRYRAHSRPMTRTDMFPLQGRINCLHCGRTVSGHHPTGKNYGYYFCNGTLQKSTARKCKESINHRNEDVNDGVRELIKEMYENEDSLRQSYKPSAPAPVVNSDESEKRELEAELQNYVRLAGKGLITDKELKRERKRIEDALRQLRKPQTSPILEPVTIQLWKNKVKDILDDDLHRLVQVADVRVLLGNNEIKLEWR